jgi:hypothetical protein
LPVRVWPPASTANALPGAAQEVVEHLTTLMRRYIAEGRSTAGAPQKSEAEMSVDKSSVGKKKQRKNVQ